MRRSHRLGVTLLMLCTAAGTGLAAPWWYRRHVESEFASFIAPYGHHEAVSILESRCIGKEADSIRLRPIVGSTLFGSTPYVDEIDAPRERASLECVYYHGYWFNYCKRIVRGSEDMLAYWSLMEDRWHLLRLKGRRSQWEEVTEQDVPQDST